VAGAWEYRHDLSPLGPEIPWTLQELNGHAPCANSSRLGADKGVISTSPFRGQSILGVSDNPIFGSSHIGSLSTQGRSPCLEISIANSANWLNRVRICWRVNSPWKS